VEAKLPVETKLRLQSLQAMSASERCALVDGIVGATFCLQIRAIPGETLDLGLPNWTMATLCASLPLEAIAIGTIAGWWRQEVEWCSSTASTTPSLGGVAQRGFGDDVPRWSRAGRGTVWCRGGTDGKPGEWLHFGLTPWSWVGGKRGGGDLRSLCTRHFLWISPGSPRRR
jgi:hypothetical protein